MRITGKLKLVEECCFPQGSARLKVAFGAAMALPAPWMWLWGSRGEQEGQGDAGKCCGTTAGRRNPCTGAQVTRGDMSGEHLSPERQKDTAPASCVWMCATFQKDLFASLVSGTDRRTRCVPVTVPFLRSGVFWQGRGSKTISYKEGQGRSARTPGTCPGSEQPRGDTGLSHVCGTGSVSLSLHRDSVVPLRGSPTPGGSKCGHF